MRAFSLVPKRVARDGSSSNQDGYSLIDLLVAQTIFVMTFASISMVLHQQAKIANRLESHVVVALSLIDSMTKWYFPPGYKSSFINEVDYPDAKSGSSSLTSIELSQLPPVSIATTADNRLATCTPIASNYVLLVSASGQKVARVYRGSEQIVAGKCNDEDAFEYEAEVLQEFGYELPDNKLGPVSPLVAFNIQDILTVYLNKKGTIRLRSYYGKENQPLVDDVEEIEFTENAMGFTARVSSKGKAKVWDYRTVQVDNVMTKYDTMF
mgnify:CR=1 FL=1